MATESAIRAAMGMIAASGIGGAPKRAADVDPMVDVWLIVLEELDDVDLQARVVQWLRTGEKWWPVPGALLRHAGTGKAVQAENRIASEKQAEAIAIELWHECAVPAAKRSDAPVTRYADDEAEERAVRAGIKACGGRTALAEADERQMEQHRRAFLLVAARTLVQEWGGGLRVIAGEAKGG